MTLDQLNHLPEPELLSNLMRCCASQRWCQLMAQARPYTSPAALKVQAEAAAAQLNSDDWQQAFAAHPQIGDISSLAKRFADTEQWAKGEQGDTVLAADSTLVQLAELNQRYLERHGFIFIVYASGKTAEQMLALLKARVNNDTGIERLIAAQEQLLITQLRLMKLIGVVE